MKRAIAAMAVTALLAGCSTKINPVNWFEAEQAEDEATALQVAAPVDPRNFVDGLVDVQAEKLPTGLLIRATGLTPEQGWWDAGLVALPVEDGVLRLEFRAYPPINTAVIQTPRSGEVTAIKALSHNKLRHINRIEVQTASGIRSLSR